jgi:N-hydroxyarylamine O-acetyltransferase
MTGPTHPARDSADQTLVDEYLERLAVERLKRSDLSYLRTLHAAHLQRVPFENLSIHLGEPISLEPAALATKILTRGRGGFCYELNGLFAGVLDQLGYRVTLLGARVWDGETFGPPLDHLVLKVGTTDDGLWIVDVGFGDHSVYPLRWREGIEHCDPGGSFRLEAAENGSWDLYRNGSVQYRIEPNPRVLADFDAMCWYHQTSPCSHFTRSVVCTRRTEAGRMTLRGRRLTITTADGKQETEIEGDTRLLDTYQNVFGIQLDRIPTVPAPRHRDHRLGGAQAGVDRAALAIREPLSTVGEEPA